MRRVIPSQPYPQVRVGCTESRHQAKKLPSHTIHGEWRGPCQVGTSRGPPATVRREAAVPKHPPIKVMGAKVAATQWREPTSMLHEALPHAGQAALARQQCYAGIRHTGRQAVAPPVHEPGENVPGTPKHA